MYDFRGAGAAVFAVGRVGTTGVSLLGTAFSLPKRGYFATAFHVSGVDEANLVLVLKPQQSLVDYQDTSDASVQTIPLRIAAVDPLRDLAVLFADVPLESNVRLSGADNAAPGTPITSIGYPHADSGRMVLTRHDSTVGARVLIAASGVKSRHLVLNTQARPGQSGSPIFRTADGLLVGVLVGSYAPGGGGLISLGGVDPHTLHQTTHAVSAEYLPPMMRS